MGAAAITEGISKTVVTSLHPEAPVDHPDTVIKPLVTLLKSKQISSGPDHNLTREVARVEQRVVEQVALCQAGEARVTIIMLTH